ncbi:MAG: putative selenate reductase subunit YgfK [Vallitalea sp.]|jgi:putative selenate reductase|nr:putative selenate reductase subunit YgfK [Vallitalea sp.]
MSDRMTPISFAHLIEWILEEKENHNTIFGVRNHYKMRDTSTYKIFNETLELPFGPAAGPHTQLTQNIICAYIAGCRFFELKTVQTLDGEDLHVSKPCINAVDEGYNVEWSTELTVTQAYEEYVKAYILLKLLSKEYTLGDSNGFIFNMSVGYDYEGICSDKINTFIENLKNASNTHIWKKCISYTINNINKFNNVDETYVREISPSICNSITLSTLHGCPSKEIERIASYLLQEKNLNTYIKCNPTMLGYEYTRTTLDKMGYDYIDFNDYHFTHDLQFEDAIPMLQRLQNIANMRNLEFGVKLTNTFPVKITDNRLPGDEMYMSGVALFPLSISLAYKLAKAFNGNIKISYSGGADIYNITEIIDTGIWPVTLATTLLKPGGYERCIQIANKLNASNVKSENIIDVHKLKQLRDKMLQDCYYIKPIKPNENYKIKSSVPLIDCFIAPCEKGCPINQDIPAYIHLLGEGKHLEALKIIIDKNPLPYITGTICNHNCMTKCTRNFYEQSISIREAKLYAAKSAYKQLLSEIKPQIKSSNAKVAIIGGGPAGLSAGYFLSRSGIDVTIYEKRNSLGGIVKHVVPEFRISSESVNRDIDLITKMGVKFVLGSEQCSIDTLKSQGYKYILFAIGAWKPNNLSITGATPINVLDFLERLRNNDTSLQLGENVVVIGGGNTAMDAARAAKRVSGVNNVSIVYRRTKKYMPADEEELLLALEEGVHLRELLSPVEVIGNMLACCKMKLGQPDDTGRRRPIKTNEIEYIPANTIISSIGEKFDTKLFVDNGISVDNKGYVMADWETCETNKENVYVAGDALRGPSTIVECIADATKFSLSVISKEKIKESGFQSISYRKDFNRALAKKGTLVKYNTPLTEGKRCLECSTICESCVDVCPNRANIAINIDGKLMRQIVHIDSMCNECGNCEAFCPYTSAPYKHKFTLFSTIEDFNNSSNEGFVMYDIGDTRCQVRLDCEVLDVKLMDDNCVLPRDIENIIWVIYRRYGYLIK